MKLSFDEFAFLKDELEKTRIMNEADLKYIKSAHEYMYLTVHNIFYHNRVLHTQNCWFYTLENDKLNKFLCDKFNEPIHNLYTIHRLIYGVGGKCQRHTDRFTTHKTVSVLLSDDFTGGDMYINDKRVNLNNKGEYIIFNGGKDFHNVDEIKSGYRDVLIIWFSNKKSKFNII